MEHVSLVSLLNSSSFESASQFLDALHIAGLAEAGLISSKLSRQDMHQSLDGGQVPVLFSPER